uniref:Uncharacterized protein n=1 Tax=Glossina pallidipes TaxID=7398 RepID=A0A1B0AGZ0_GLOPL
MLLSGPTAKPRGQELKASPSLLSAVVDEEPIALRDDVVLRSVIGEFSRDFKACDERLRAKSELPPKHGTCQESSITRFVKVNRSVNKLMQETVRKKERFVNLIRTLKLNKRRVRPLSVIPVHLNRHRRYQIDAMNGYVLNDCVVPSSLNNVNVRCRNVNPNRRQCRWHPHRRRHLGSLTMVVIR